MDCFKFFNIVPYYPGNEEQTAQDLIELYQRTGISRMLYSLSFHPEGRNPLEKAERLVASYRKLRDALVKEPGIQCGVLIQSILGHVIGNHPDSAPWVRCVTDRELPPGVYSRYCSFDPEFSDYIRAVGAMVAKEKPFFILGDDDIRSWSNGVECFCELHTAEYNRRHGTSFTPEEYRKAVCESEADSELYQNYDRLRQDTVNRVAALIREGIDSVDPTIPGGSCMPGGEYYFNQDTARALGAKDQKETVMRVCNANYVEQSPRDLAFNAYRTQGYRKYHSGVQTVIDESDTFPHSLFSKSAISFHAKECSAIFNGLNGAKLWFVNCRRPGVVVSRKYTDILAKYSKFYNTLYQEVSDSESDGMRIPLNTDFGGYHAIKNRLAHFVPFVSWSEYAGIYGIPFFAEKDYELDAVYAVRGSEFINRRTDAEILTLLKGKLLIDGAAAIELTKRGFGKYLGVEAKTPEHPFNNERYVGSTAPIYCRTWKDSPALFPLTDKLEVLTEMVYLPYIGCAEAQVICPGAVVYNNELGGRICTTVFNTSEEFTLRAGMPRKNWMIKLLSALDPEAVKGTVLAEQPLMSIMRKTKDGSKLLMICNMGFDALDELEIKFAGATKVEQLNPDGSWQNVDFSVNDDVITVKRGAICYETVILKIK